MTEHTCSVPGMEPAISARNVHEAKTQLSRLIERIEMGEEIIIARAGRPVARLTAIAPAETGRRFGAMKS